MEDPQTQYQSPVPPADESDTPTEPTAPTPEVPTTEPGVQEEGSPEDTAPQGYPSDESVDASLPNE